MRKKGKKEKVVYKVDNVGFIKAQFEHLITSEKNIYYAGERLALEGLFVDKDFFKTRKGHSELVKQFVLDPPKGGLSGAKWFAKKYKHMFVHRVK